MIIYKATNILNGKSYIGQTIQSLNKRIQSHLHEQKNTYLHNALVKDGLKNFEWQKVMECHSKEEMDYWEKFFIKCYNTKKPNGYNLTDGGEGNLGWHPTEEIKKKIGDKNRGRSPSKETREIWSEQRKGEKHPLFGKKRDCPWMKERNKKLCGEKHPMFGKTGYWSGKKRPDHSEKMKGKMKGEKNPMSKENRIKRERIHE